MKSLHWKSELVYSDDVTDVYESLMGIQTIWKKDGSDRNGVRGKEGTSKMVYFDPKPRAMSLKKKYRK